MINVWGYTEIFPSDVCFEVLSCFFHHPSIDSTKKMPLHLFGKDVLMFRLNQAS